MKRTITLILGLTLSLPTTLLYAQNDTLNQQEKNKKFSINLRGGFTRFHGDIDGLRGRIWKGGLKYNFNEVFGIEGAYRTGKLKGGDDKYGRKFENDFHHYGVNAILNFSKISRLSKILPDIAVMAKGGIHRMKSNAKDEWIGDPEVINPREEYTGTDFVFPFGGKIKYNLSKRFDIGVELDYVYTNSDDMDNYAILIPANRDKDGYSTYTLGLTFKLGDIDAEHADWDQDNELEEKIDQVDRKHTQKHRVNTEQIKTLEENKADKNEIKSLYSEVENIKSWKKEVEDWKKSEIKEEEASKRGKGDQKGSGDFQLDNRRFVTVVGSYKNLERAKNFADKISDKGFNPKVIYNYYRDWYYVYVEKHEKFEDAVDSRSKVMDDLNINDTWIYFRSADDLNKYKH